MQTLVKAQPRRKMIALKVCQRNVNTVIFQKYHCSICRVQSLSPQELEFLPKAHREQRSLLTKEHHSYITVYTLLFCLMVLGIKPRALYMLVQCSTNELHPQPGVIFYGCHNIRNGFLFKHWEIFYTLRTLISFALGAFSLFRNSYK